MNKKLSKKLTKLLPDIKEWLNKPDSPDTLCIVERAENSPDPTIMLLLTVDRGHIESIETYFEMMGEDEN